VLAAGGVTGVVPGALATVEALSTVREHSTLASGLDPPGRDVRPSRRSSSPHVRC
jgi:hypothetical protein